MNLVVANLKTRVIKALKKGPMKFNKLVKTLRINDEKRLDNVLQNLRRTGQIHYTGHTFGWKTGRGRVFTPNVR